MWFPSEVSVTLTSSAQLPVYAGENLHVRVHESYMQRSDPKTQLGRNYVTDDGLRANRCGESISYAPP
jgi:hypothetical protein